MAKVLRFDDGLNHIQGGILSTLHSVCGICDDPANESIGDEFDGEVTCEACREIALKVFNSCKKSEVK